MHNAKPWQRCGILALGVCFLFVALATEGCEPILKKFRRQKKKATEESSEIPILEPIEYPKKIYSAEDVYKKHFSLWKIWQNDLIENMGNTDNKKRLFSLVGQVATNLSEMQKLLSQEKQSGLKKAIDTLGKFKNDLAAPVSVRSISSWKTELKLMEKNIRTDYTLDKVQGSIEK